MADLALNFLWLLGQMILAPIFFFALFYVIIIFGQAMAKAMFWIIGAIIFLRK